jgi:hypothetical protein
MVFPSLDAIELVLAADHIASLESFWASFFLQFAGMGNLNIPLVLSAFLAFPEVTEGVKPRLVLCLSIKPERSHQFVVFWEGETDPPCYARGQRKK